MSSYISLPLSSEPRSPYNANYFPTASNSSVSSPTITGSRPSTRPPLETLRPDLTPPIIASHSSRTYSVSFNLGICRQPSIKPSRGYSPIGLSLSSEASSKSLERILLFSEWRCCIRSMIHTTRCPNRNVNTTYPNITPEIDLKSFTLSLDF